MNDPMPTARPVMAATDLVARMRRAVWRARVLRVGFGTCAGGAALVLALFLADAAWALSDTLRMMVVPGVGLGAVVAVATVVLMRKRWQPDEATAARISEQALGVADRVVLAAWQLERMGGELAHAGAERVLARLSLPERWRLRDTGISPWSGLYALAACAGLALVIHATNPGLFAVVWDRFRDPYGDHPPFSRIQMSWGEAPARVREGDAARFAVVADAPLGDAALCFAACDAAGMPSGPVLGRVPMFSVGTDRSVGEIARCRTPLAVWVETAGTRTRYHRLAIDPVPVFRHLDLRLDQPGYAALDPESRRVKPGDIAEFSALPGSRITLVADANRALAALWLFRDDQGLKRLPLQDGQVVLENLAAGVHAVAPEATDGVRGDPVPILRLSMRVDAPPQAEIVSPSRDAVATPTMRIPLVYAASDDLGLRTLHHQTLWNHLPAPMVDVAVSGRSARVEHAFEGAIQGVAPGEVVELVVMARDTNPGEGQLSASAHRTIRIIAEDEYNRMLLRRLKPEALRAKYSEPLKRLRELESAMQALRERMHDAQNDEAAKLLKALGEQARQLAADMRAMRRDKPLWAIEPALQKQIEDAAERIAAAAADGSALERQVAALLSEDVDKLVAMARAKGLVARLRQIIDAEQNTANRFDSFADPRRLNDTDRVQLRELGDQETAIAQAIDQWQEAASAVVAPLKTSADPACQSAATKLEKLATALRGTEATTLKRLSAQIARQGDGREARRLAGEARDRLLALLGQAGQCDGACDGMGLGLGWGDGRGFGQGMNLGWGMGGSGSAGLGFALGYGGDDANTSLPSDAMDLYGPEAFSDAGLSRSDDAKGDGIAELAGSPNGPPRSASGYHRAVRAGTATLHTPLSPGERTLIEDYWRRLQEGER